MSGLNLTPNEKAGYRVRPDYHNWTVVLVKLHGPQSKSAGQEYDTPVGYYKTLPMALRAINDLETRLVTAELQDELRKNTGAVASLSVIEEAVRRGQAAAEEAGRALEEQMQAAGVSVTDLAKALRMPEPDASTD
jgi:hypothetical protein